MAYKVPQGRIKPKKEAMFGKKPFKGKEKNRKGRLKKSIRLKPKYNSKNKKLFDVEDAKYIEWLQCSSYSCFVCGGHNGIEWHHVKKFSTDKKDHTRLIPLCGVEHHRLGAVLSAHGTPKKWRETFSMEVQLEYAANIYEDYLAEML